jgi:putative membrane protein
MPQHLTEFLIHWGIMSLSLWVASYIFKGLKFDNTASLVVSALMLGFANAILRPILIFLTLPLTLLTLGFFMLVINALMVMLVSSMVKGFRISGFWTAFFVAIFIALFSLFIEHFLPGSTPVLIPSGHSISV